MCGRFSVKQDEIEPWVMDQFDVSFQCQTNLDIRPTQTIATLRNTGHKLEQFNVQWGIQPSWAKKLIINAQSETVAEKKTFKGAFAERRCLIPCSGWYEWKNQKYLFTQADKSPLLMAGIWYETDDQPQLVTLTTKPNQKCAEIHQRMPVLIQLEDVDYWFHSAPEQLTPIIQALNSEKISLNQCSE